MESITAKHIKAFENYLISEEKSAATVEKYSRDIKAFTLWLNGAELNKISVLEYKSYISSKYAVASVMIAISLIWSAAPPEKNFPTVLLQLTKSFRMTKYLFPIQVVRLYP